MTLIPTFTFTFELGLWLMIGHLYMLKEIYFASYVKDLVLKHN